MTLGLKRLDLAFVTILLLLSAVPLFLLRSNPLLGRWDCLAAVVAVLVGAVALWAFLARRAAQDAPAAGGGADGGVRLGWWRTALIAGLLGAVAVLNFYNPLRIHFWGGADECCNFQEKPLLEWMGDWDEFVNRPLTPVPCTVGHALTPGRVEGFLWLAAVLCWANGLLLFGVLRELLPRARLLPAVAALLLVIDPSDESRFFVMWAANFYWTALVLLLLGAWLFLLSLRRGSRPLLALSCLALVAALLTNEGAFPLAALVPALAWLRKEYRPRLPVWGAAWCGTVGLLAIRFLLFLLVLSKKYGGAYQGKMWEGVRERPGVVWETLLLHLGVWRSAFRVTGALTDHWRTAAAVLAVVAALAGLAVWRVAAREPRRRQYLVALGLAALAVLFGAAPFLHIQCLFRTHYFAAPGQAVALACGLCLAGSLLGRRVGTAAVAAVIGLVVANATAESLTAQHQRRARSPGNFERMVHIFRQVHAVCPQPAPDTLILLIPDDPTAAPFQANYCCLYMSRRLLGTGMIQVGTRDDAEVTVTFHPDGVEMGRGVQFGYIGKTGYDRVLAFRLARDNTVTLLRQLPERLAPPGAAVAYDPLPLLRPGPVSEPVFLLQYPLWARPPADVFDMGDGVLPGHGWGPLELRQDRLERRVKDGAELVVNPMGRTQRELRLRVDLAGADRLEARAADGRVVASAAPDGDGTVVLTLPANPARVGLVHLHAIRDTGAVASFRVICPGRKLADYQQRAISTPEIVGDGLTVGANWHTLELSGGDTFRWVTNDAELLREEIVEGQTELLVDLQPGAGMGGRPCQLTLQDQNGQALGTACVTGRETVCFPLPATAAECKLFRLHVDGGGTATPPDPRILNFRVFRCYWKSEECR